MPITTDELDTTNPNLDPEPGWSRLPPVPEEHRPRSFVSGDPQGDRLRVRYYRRDDDGALVGKVWFGPGAEGPPGSAHGGSMAAVLDEAMGAAAWISGNLALAATITTRFKQMLPLGTTATLEAWVIEVVGRKVHARSRLINGDGTVFCEGEGTYVAVDPDLVFPKGGLTAAQQG